MAAPPSGGDADIREMTRTPVNALADQFQNGMVFQDGGHPAQGSVYRNMNRSRSPGRELDSQPPVHYENGMASGDQGFHPPNGYPPSYESEYGRMGPATGRNRSDPYAPNNTYSGGPYSMDPNRPMDYG